MRTTNIKPRGLTGGVIVFCCAASLLFLPRAHAQIAGTGNIQGTISDASGAVIPDADVTLTDKSTHVQRTTKTNGAGAYVFPGIPVGTYDLGASAKGFRSYLRTGIVLEVGSSIAVNPQLSVGRAETQVRPPPSLPAVQVQHSRGCSTTREARPRKRRRGSARRSGCGEPEGRGYLPNASRSAHRRQRRTRSPSRC